MRWYSVKDYVIPKEIILFVCSNEGFFYCGSYKTDNSWSIEECDDSSIPEVTHFCVPSPVPIEEWLEMRNIHTIGVE